MKALRCVGIILTMFGHVLKGYVVFGNADSRLGGRYVIVCTVFIIWA